MVDRYGSDCAELCHFPNDSGDWVYYEDYAHLEQTINVLTEQADSRAAENKRLEAELAVTHKRRAAIEAMEAYKNVPPNAQYNAERREFLPPGPVLTVVAPCAKRQATDPVVVEKMENE